MVYPNYLPIQALDLYHSGQDYLKGKDLGRKNKTFNRVPVETLTNPLRTYELKDQINLFNLLQEALQYIAKMTPTEQKKYANFIAGIRYNRDGSPDINNFNTQKAFLALKKVVKHKGQIPSYAQLGRHDENFTLLGVYNAQYRNFRHRIADDPSLETIMNNFYNEIYLSGMAWKMLSEYEVTQGEKYAVQILDAEMERYGVEDRHLLYRETDYDTIAYYSPFLSNQVTTMDVDNNINDWHLQLDIDAKGRIIIDGVIKHQIKELIILHELYHIKQAMPGRCMDKQRDFFVELGAILHLIVCSDEVYKKIYGIDLDGTINYGLNFDMGRLANTFREVKAKYNLETYEEAMLTTEGLEFIKENFRSTRL